MHMKRACLVILVAALTVACERGSAPAGPVAPVAPQAPLDLKSSLSAAFDALAIPAGAGCSTSVSRNGQVLLERGRGQVAPGRAAEADSFYRIGSLTKPITAVTLLISEKAGRVNRNDTIGQYLSYGGPAPTLDELIKHVPGLPNYSDYVAYATRSTPTSVENLLSFIPLWDGVKRDVYSNSHAAYTGAILEKVNGLRYEDVVHRDIFGPVGMSRSSFTMPAASESAGYPMPSEIHPTWAYAAGGVTSTAPDMTRFFQALLSNQFGIGAVEGFDRSGGITSFAMFSNGGGELRFIHNGIIDSYYSHSSIFPADRSSIVVLCNFASNGLTAFATGVRNILVGAQ
jgi:D-alanyl-D-alanine carboxypeptidase